MRSLDWIILIAFLAFIALYGLWRGRRARTAESYLLAGRSLRWYTVLFSIMATQASAITFLSTPGQAYADGMRFIQFYFGLPLAMVVLSITVVPLFHRLKVYTAYEYLEQRFDGRVRTLTAALFLVQRGLAAGLTIYAPALIFATILGWDIFWMNLVFGSVVVLYTASGGTRAVSHTQTVQVLIIFTGMVVACTMLIRLLPAQVSLLDATRLAGKLGKLESIDPSFNLHSRYTLWSGLIGGFFLQLSYFGTDQSQVQRYLTGKSVTQSRMGLLFNGLLKIPMQISILFLGVLVFVFYQFTAPPLFFNAGPVTAIRHTPQAAVYADLEQQYAALHAEKQAAIGGLLTAMHREDAVEEARYAAGLKQTNGEMQAVRESAIDLLAARHPGMDRKDTNFVFLTFLVHYLPVGLLGLVIAAIVAAAMGSTAAELNALASTTTVDFYRRFRRQPQATTAADASGEEAGKLDPAAAQAVNQAAAERRTVRFSRGATLFWGFFAVAFADYASRLGSLIEAVNILGSLFYGTILGIFLTAFYMPRVGGRAVFRAALAAETVVVACFLWSGISFLWYNLIGCLAVMGLSWLPSLSRGRLTRR
ncbi:MAG TPA: sodium:solute symporter [bacterium]|nr:sodium:solute symporter [bacterium]HQG47103.1 sodium:solute symporter [bacterium]HQJ64158.1 sodium:solute symporter [bacterium]